MAVYFIRAGEDGPIKVGTADNAEGRLRELQCGNHLELRIIRTLEGGRDLERALHRRYEHLRSRGEWFAFTPDMLVVEVSDVAIPDSEPVGDMPEPCKTLLAKVEAALEQTGMTPASFGRKAVGDPSLVFQLRKGREPRYSTAQRVCAFIESMVPA